VRVRVRMRKMRHLIRSCGISAGRRISRIYSRLKLKKNFIIWRKMRVREMRHLTRRCGIWSGHAASPAIWWNFFFNFSLGYMREMRILAEMQYLLIRCRIFLHFWSGDAASPVPSSPVIWWIFFKIQPWIYAGDAASSDQIPHLPTLLPYLPTLHFSRVSLNFSRIPDFLDMWHLSNNWRKSYWRRSGAPFTQKGAVEKVPIASLG